MDELEKYKKFAKIKDDLVMTNNAVVYTRVSSKEQSDGNASLDTQLKYCKEYAEKKNLNIVEYFGGTYESAKSDERKEFSKMLEYLKRKKSISYVIVYSYDRFSRTGANAAYISSNLKKKGIHTISVSQEVDTSKPSGIFQENLYYMFSQFDNEMRKDKTVTGMREKLRNGYWCVRLPFGYTNTNKGSTADKSNIILNKDGKMIKKAFLWVYKNNWSLTRVSIETKKHGNYIDNKKLSVYLRNPFYAGLLVSSLTPGEINKGKHERAISPEIFNTVNDILNNKTISRKGIRSKKTLEEAPLRGFLICDECNQHITAYKASKNKKYYYKCNTKGCKNNQRAEQVHDNFKDVLKYFQIDKKYIKPLKEHLKEKFAELNIENEAIRNSQKSALKAIEKKHEKLEEKYIYEGISTEIYQKHLAKLMSEKTEIERSLTKPEIKLSNLDKLLDFSTKTSTNLLNIWENEDYDKKVKIQKLVFPNGIKYNRKKELYRTEKINSIFSLNLVFSDNYKDKKESRKLIINENSALVPRTRLELARP